MASLLKKFKDSVKSQDYFARAVTFTFKGEDSFKSFCGGCVTILLILAFVANSSYGLFQLCKYPTYNNSPPTYNYTKTNGTFPLDMAQNQMAFRIDARDQDQIWEYFRIVFYNGTSNKTIPAENCTWP